MNSYKYMICENVKRYKEANNLSSRKMAKLSKINDVTIVYLTIGQQVTTRVETVYKLSRLMNVSIDDLLYKEIQFNN